MPLGWGQVGDIKKQGYRSAAEIAAAIRSVDEYVPSNNAHNGGPSLWDFYQTMQFGELVILRTHVSELVVEIAGEYEWREEKMPLAGDYNHQRKVRILTRSPEELWRQSGGIKRGIFRALALCPNPVD